MCVFLTCTVLMCTAFYTAIIIHVRSTTYLEPILGRKGTLARIRDREDMEYFTPPYIHTYAVHSCSFLTFSFLFFIHKVLSRSDFFIILLTPPGQGSRAFGFRTLRYASVCDASSRHRQGPTNLPAGHISSTRLGGLITVGFTHWVAGCCFFPLLPFSAKPQRIRGKLFFL